MPTITVEIEYITDDDSLLTIEDIHHALTNSLTNTLDGVLFESVAEQAYCEMCGKPGAIWRDDGNPVCDRCLE